MLHQLTIVAVTAIALLASITTTSAETITVCAKGCVYTSINAAIDASRDGDVIQLAAETYSEGDAVNTDGKAITILGVTDKNGAPASILDGDDTHGLLECTSGEGSETTFANLVIRNGSTDFGGGLFIAYESSPTLDNCLFTENSGYDGGGVAVLGDNRSIMKDCIFRANSAAQDGGGMMVFGRSRPTLIDCTFTNNTATRNGGGLAIAIQSGAMLHDCSFTENSAMLLGGGIYLRDNLPESQTSINRCGFESNASAFGAGMHSESCSPALNDCWFTSNAAQEAGGGMSILAGIPRLAGCAFAGNTAASGGGAIHSFEDVMDDPSRPDLVECIFISNSAGSVSGDFTTSSAECIPGDLDGDGDYDESDIRLGMDEFGIIESGAHLAGDADGDGDVDADDRAAVNDALGLCAADINGDGEVNAADLAFVLGYWGLCSAP